MQYQSFLPILAHLAVDVAQLSTGTCFEMFMHVDVLAIRMASFTKAIHIELADEGAEVAMLEVTRQHFLCESANVLNVKGVSAGCPANDLGDIAVLSYTNSTYTIYSNLLMNSGTWLLLPLRLRLRFI